MICKEKGYDILDSETAQENLVAEHTGPGPESALSSRHPGVLGLHHLLSGNSHCIAGFLMGIFSLAGVLHPQSGWSRAHLLPPLAD